MQIDEDPSWQDPIIDYLMNENLPMDKVESSKGAAEGREILHAQQQAHPQIILRPSSHLHKVPSNT